MARAPGEGARFHCWASIGRGRGHLALHRPHIAATVKGVEDVTLTGVQDDSFDRPHVTPDPAPSDDGLFRMAGLGSAIAGIVAVLAWRWLRANIVISRR